MNLRLEVRSTILPLLKLPDATGAVAALALDLQRTAGALLDVRALESTLWAALNAATPDDVLPLLFEVWSKVGDVREAAASGELRVVPLGEHTFSARHTPEIKIEINHLPRWTIPIDFGIDLDISCVILTIDAGQVRDVRLGKVVATATFGICGRELKRQALLELELN